MKEISQEDLIGFLLGALEPDEERVVEDALAQDVSLRDQLAGLEEQLTCLPDRFVEIDPPVGLADKTINTISIVDSSIEPLKFDSSVEPIKADSSVEPIKADSSDTPVKLTPKKEVAVGGRSWSVMDFIVSAVVCFVIAAVLLPSISQSRFNSNRLQCQENLRNIGFSMASIADSFDGDFLLPEGADHWPAGLFVQRIMETGLANDIEGFICPNDPGKEQTAQICRKAWCDINLLTPDEEFAPTPNPQDTNAAPANIASGDVLVSDKTVAQKAIEPNRFRCSSLQMTEAASGSYGFPAPQATVNGFQKIKIPCSPNYVLCADAACFGNPGYRSRNHGNKGQNVLLGDLSVEYICDPACLPSGDHIYTNNQGQIQPGVTPGDNMIYRGVIESTTRGH